MKPYEIIGHTADIGLKVTGSTLKELFRNAARGMCSIIWGEKAPFQNLNKTGVEVNKKIKIEKGVEGFEELLVAWLSEILYIFNNEKIFFTDFKISELNNNGIVGTLNGIKIDHTKATPQAEIKAVTFHGLKIEKSIGGFSCSIIFDV